MISDDFLTSGEFLNQKRKKKTAKNNRRILIASWLQLYFIL